MKDSKKSLFMQTVYLTVALAILPLAGVSCFLFMTDRQYEENAARDNHIETVLLGAHNVEQLFAQAFMALYAARLRDLYPGTHSPAKSENNTDSEELVVRKFSRAEALLLFGKEALKAPRTDSIVTGLPGQTRQPEPATPARVAVYRPPLPSPATSLPSAAPSSPTLPTDAVYTLLPSDGQARSGPVYVLGIACNRVRDSLSLESLPRGASLQLLLADGQSLCSSVAQKALSGGSSGLSPESSPHAAPGTSGDSSSGSGTQAASAPAAQTGHFAAIAQVLVPGVDTADLQVGLVPGDARSATRPADSPDSRPTDSPPDTRPADRHETGLSLLLFAWAAVIFLACWFLHRRLGKPVSRLVQSALELSDHDYASRVRGPFAVIEFKRLAGVLNSLARQIDTIGRSLSGVKRDKMDDTEYTTDLLANMSHEFRTPLNTIIGMAYLSLRSDDLDPVQKSYVSRIHHTSSQLQQTINSILELSRLEQSAAGSPNSEFVLRDIFEEQHRRFFPRAKSKGLSLEYTLDANVPDELAGDPVRLAHIIGVLIDNAVRYTETGGVSVRCAVEKRQLYTATLRITVQDTGPGMSRGQQSLYKRVLSGRPLPLPDTHGKGGRVGIMLAHRLALLMDGRLALESQPGRGTKVSLLVPVGVRAQNTARADAFSLENIRVLAIDDDPLSLTILDGILHKYGALVTTQLSPEKGLALVKEADETGRPYHVLLLDWRMPGLDGATLAKRVRQDESLTRMPAIIMLSAYGWEGIPIQAQQSGADAFLHKPVAENLLLEAIDSLISMDRQAPDEPPQHAAEPDTKALEGMQVLVVEDNLLNQEIVRELLNEIGVKTQYAENGSKALDIFESAPADAHIDLVLMDLQMPEMDGFEATRRIRRLTGPFTPDLPIIAMTAFARELVAEAAEASGMDDYVSKPFDTKDFFNTLLRWRPVNQAGPGIRHKELARLLLACKRASPDVLARYEDVRDFLLSYAHEGRVEKLDSLLDAGKYLEAGAFLERVIDVLSGGGLPREKTDATHTAQLSSD